MFNSVLVATDGSDHASKAIDQALMIAEQCQGKLTVLCAFDPVPTYYGEPYFTQAIEKNTLWADDVIDRAMERIGKPAIQVESTVMQGPAAEAILDVAENRGIDLIVVGVRGLGTLRGALLGSVSQKVAQHSKCPVLIAK